jgi:hypothetical protein
MILFAVVIYSSVKRNVSLMYVHVVHPYHAHETKVIIFFLLNAIKFDFMISQCFVL